MNFTQGYPDEVYALRSDGRASSDDGAAALDVRAILNILWRARAGMIAGALLGFVVAAAYVASLAPTFTATAKVLFSPDTRRVVDIDNVMVNDGRDGLQNQIEILKSSQLMQQVVRRAGLTDVPFFNPQLRPAIRWRQSMPPLFDTIVAAPSEFLRAVGLMGQESQDGALAVQGGERVKAAKHILAASTEFEPVPDSRVIAIVVTTDRPQLSARVANSVAREYVTAQLDAKLGATREATTWLNARVSELKSELAHAEAAVGRFQAELTEDGHGDKRQLDAQINALNQAIAAASTQRAAAQARFRAVRNAMVSADGSARAADFDRSEVISRARSRARDLAIDRAKLAAMVDPGHERLQQIDASLAAVTAEIGAEEDRIARALEHTATVEAAKEAALREQADSLKQRRAARDEATLKQNALEREAEATRLIYETFLSRLKETTQQEKLQVADAVIISPAEA
ncbi:MAG: GumC family protein, partial [Pseudomonadota bacterium]